MITASVRAGVGSARPARRSGPGRWTGRTGPPAPHRCLRRLVERLQDVDGLRDDEIGEGQLALRLLGSEDPGIVLRGSGSCTWHVDRDRPVTAAPERLDRPTKPAADCVVPWTRMMSPIHRTLRRGRSLERWWPCPGRYGAACDSTGRDALLGVRNVGTPGAPAHRSMGIDTARRVVPCRLAWANLIAALTSADMGVSNLVKVRTSSAPASTPQRTRRSAPRSSTATAPP